MAGTVREARLGTRTSRARLKRGRMPHWQTIVSGKSHLGYQRWPGDRCGRWMLRRRVGSGYTVTAIGVADDDQIADGISVLTHDEARHRAVEMSSSGERPAGRITVRQACADYLDHLAAVGRPTRNAEASIVAHVLPTLGDATVADLTAARLRRWLSDLAATPARVRSPRHGPQRFRPLIVTNVTIDGEAARKRRASANRILAALKAALNLCFDEGRVATNAAWGRRLKPFRGASAARVRFLSVDEA